MKKILLFKFYYKNVYLETEDDDTFDYVASFEKFMKDQIKRGIEEFEEKQFLKELYSLTYNK